MDLIKFDFPTAAPTIIKVLGIGGGGGNAVTHMYREGDIREVSFVLCNTDNQALQNSEVPVKIQLGKQTTKGLGAGHDPEKGRKAAEESVPELKHLLDDGTAMVFVTTGLGGGTGTGATPVIAGVARGMGKLTVGIVTLPFVFEAGKAIERALKSLEEIRKNVDALLVINNQRLLDDNPDIDILSLYQKNDETLTSAVKSISEIITKPGYINRDFADVSTILSNGGAAVIGTGTGSGTQRVSKAIANALRSPMLKNNDIYKAKKMLLNTAYSLEKPMMGKELGGEISDFIRKFDPNMEVISGLVLDPELCDSVKITILATGFDLKDIVPDVEIPPADDGESKWMREQMEIHYGDWIKTGRPKPFIFNRDNMDDNEIIEAVINNPAWNRDPQVMRDVERKAKERRMGNDMA
jgi:cell division protein FtsZ